MAGLVLKVVIVDSRPVSIGYSSQYISTCKLLVGGSCMFKVLWAAVMMTTHLMMMRMRRRMMMVMMMMMMMS